MPKITIGQALSAWGAASELADTAMPGALAVKVRRLLRELGDVNEERVRLVKQYADMDTKLGVYKVREAELDAYIKAFDEFAAQKVEIAATITEQELAGLPSVKPLLLMSLGPLLLEE